MAYNTREQALENFRSRYNEEEFTCAINKISSGYVYVATPLNKINKRNHSFLPVDYLRSLKSFEDKLGKEKQPSIKTNSFVATVLNKAKKHPINTPKNIIDEEPLSDEAMKVVISDRAKRKKPVPYVREEFSSGTQFNINQPDSGRLRCIYCGDYRSGIVRDHVVSVAWRGGKRHYDRSHTVPSCPQCNSLLGDKPLHNIASRAEYLIGAIEHYERRYLFTVDRTPEELAELDHFLAISVKSAMYEKAVALQRIEYAKQVAAGHYEYATIKHLIKQGREFSED